jgi:hypothetical protein
MMFRQHHSGAWLIALLSTFAFGCAGTERAATEAVVAPARATCDTEARQLSEAADVYPAPKPSLAPVAKLDQGRFVYRCEQRGEWLGVMFPSVGEKVDCTERRPERMCSLGWIRRETKMEIFG